MTKLTAPPLHQHGALRPQSRCYERYNNALPGTTQVESRWSRFKTEEFKRREWSIFADLADEKTSVSSYFDYCNH